MSNDNAAFIKKAQQLFKEQDIEVKVSQLYEIFSQLSGYKNYNVAKSKNVDFRLLNINKNLISTRLFKAMMEDKIDSEMKTLSFLYENQSSNKKKNPYIFLGFHSEGFNPYFERLYLYNHMFIGLEETLVENSFKSAIAYLLNNNKNVDLSIIDFSHKKNLDVFMNFKDCKKYSNLLELDAFLNHLESEIYLRKEYSKKNDINLSKENNSNYKNKVILINDFHHFIKDLDFYRINETGSLSSKIKSIFFDGPKQGVYFIVLSHYFDINNSGLYNVHRSFDKTCFKLSSIKESKFLGYEEESLLDKKYLNVSLRGCEPPILTDDEIKKFIIF